MRRVLLDANLIVLLVVGNVGRERIAHHKRLSAYEARDWDLLIEALSQYDRIVVTPNILTEASNLVRSGDKRFQSAFNVAFAALVSDATEHYVHSNVAVAHPLFERLGLTDAACLKLKGDAATLLTTDVGLYLAALDQGMSAENFNHRRDPVFR